MRNPRPPADSGNDSPRNTSGLMLKSPLTLALILIPGIASAWWPFSSLSDPVREDIEQAETELRTLASNPVNSSPWTLGYTTTEPEKKELPPLPVEIEIRFAQPAPIDVVALLPAIFTDNQNQLQPFGFPLRFSLERLLPDGSAEMIADHRDADFPVVGIEPQFFPCPSPVPTAGLRIIITKLAPNTTWWRASHIAALSEVFAFAGQRNAALGSQVKASSSFEFSYVWSVDCLTDGFSLFSPVDQKLTNPQNNFTTTNTEVTLEFDLGRNHRIDEFHLWPVVRSVQHNYTTSNGIGFPEGIVLKGATDPGFADPQTLFKNDKLVVRPGAAPFMRRVDPAEIRYLRLTLRRGLPDFRRENRHEIALAEIEFLENGAVVSRGIRAHTPQDEQPSPMLERLTDGRSNAGLILSMRDWLTQFKRRAELERSLEALRLDLATARQREEGRAGVALLIAVGAIALLLQLIWLVRVAARRRLAGIRERIACDLHDEVGANVSSITHTAELLKETIEQPSDTQARLFTNLIDTTRLTSRETKNFISFIEGDAQALDIHEQFNKIADQILGTIPLKTSYQNMQSFNKLDPAAKWNLMLFLKEALNNIIKHAGATEVEIATKRVRSRLQLIVKDNGHGLPAGTQHCPHLSHRAKFLTGDLDISNRTGKGSRVTLTFKN